MTTFSAPFTMPRYLDAAARDLRGYFTGVTVIVADDSGVADVQPPAIVLRDGNIRPARQDHIFAEVVADLITSGATGPELAAELYAWVYRRGVLISGSGPEVRYDGYDAAQGATTRIFSWEVELPNDYTLRPLESDGYVIREIDIVIQSPLEVPLGQIELR